MKIAINGFGRIGRVFYRVACEHSDFDIVAINDLGDKDNLIYLLENDSVYGKFSPADSHQPSAISKVKFFQEKEPNKLPWGDLDIDVVVESTGFFDSYEKAKGHLEAGAKRVVITAPVLSKAMKGNGEDVLIFTPNICEGDISKSKITSNASCTTNAVAPVAKIMSETVGVSKAILNTTHAYTATQGIVDRPDAKDWRRGRAAAANISPSTTGAAIATAKVISSLEGKFDGIAVRVPIVSGSLIDFTFVSKKQTSAEEVNEIFREAAKKTEWNGIIRVSENEKLVSSDILGTSYGSIVDLELTKVIDGDLVKIFSWYDNEMGYANMLMKHIEKLREYI